MADVTTPHEKGNALEQAVLAIEQMVLHSSPNVKEKTYLIESKKHISVGGVHHEIDLFVTFELGSGYDSVYIFECKNWKDSVGKNEIIVFAEKIAASLAQRGFFIAKSFTSDAFAQATKEPRMELVTVAEYDPASTILPFGYQSTFTKPVAIKAVFTRWGTPGTKSVKYDLSQALATFGGKPFNLVEYVNGWVTEAIHESMKTFPSGTLPDGRYERVCETERKFAEGELVVNDINIGTARMIIRFDIFLVRPAVKSHFEVNGRGRVISFEAHVVGDAVFEQVQFTFGPELDY